MKMSLVYCLNIDLNILSQNTEGLEANNGNIRSSMEDEVADSQLEPSSETETKTETNAKNNQ